MNAAHNKSRRKILSVNFNAKQIKRFWSRVSKSDGCWLWTGRTINSGYGEFTFNRDRITAHKASWILANGPIPSSNLDVLHECDVKLCVNPAHLKLGTHLKNMQDAANRKLFSHGDDHYLRKNPELVAGEKNAASKLTAAQVREIRASEGVLHSELAGRYGISAQHVGAIISRQKWKYLT